LRFLVLARRIFVYQRLAQAVTIAGDVDLYGLGCGKAMFVAGRQLEAEIVVLPGKGTLGAINALQELERGFQLSWRGVPEQHLPIEALDLAGRKGIGSALTERRGEAFGAPGKGAGSGEISMCGDVFRERIHSGEELRRGAGVLIETELEVRAAEL